MLWLSERLHAMLCRYGPMTEEEMALITQASGRKVKYALWNLRSRGKVGRSGKLWSSTVAQPFIRYASRPYRPARRSSRPQ